MLTRVVRSFARLALPAALMVALAGAGAVAQQQEMPAKVRGTLKAVEGDTLVVENQAGETMGFALKEGAGLFKVTPASLADVKEGDFVGITSIERDGRRIALETHLFSEDLRGTGEGHYAWDLVKEPNMMTNATVAEVKEGGQGRTLEVDYGANQEIGSPAGRQMIVVPGEAPVVRLEKTDDRSLLQPGRDIFLMVEAPDDGPPVAVAAVVGDEGAKPPM
ncbi:MAG TPA: hypothetical protein VFZ01_05730 [Geminicoccaceae bacterium]